MSDDHNIPTAKQLLNPEPGERLARPFTRFARLSSAGGIMLLAMTVLAMVWANSRYADSYNEIFNETKTTIAVSHMPAHDAETEHDETGDDTIEQASEAIEEGVEDRSMVVGKDDKHGGHGWEPVTEKPMWYQQHSTQMWINDLLMAIFFLVVGLEIKREILVGELASPKRAALPVFGALGGMVGPALIFASINWGKDTIHGWGIPMATDIAFAVGILAMLGSRIPNSLKVFLTSLAIVDDLGALVVIAVFYTDNLQLEYLGYAGAVIALLMFMNILRVRWITLYLVLGLPLWYFVYQSGVHATIAGVLLAMTIPAHARVNAVNFVFSTRKALEVFEKAHSDPETDVKESTVRRAAVNAIIANARQVLPPLHRIEYVLHPWVAFFIIPVFALANAGIPIHGGIGENLSDPAAIGIILGLFLGKPLGIVLLAWLACKVGIASLPKGVSWRHIVGAGMLAGIGFTMAIFIANLAYANNASHLEHAKLAILVASTLSAIGGGLVLLSCRNAPEPEPDTLGPLVDDDGDD